VIVGSCVYLAAVSDAFAFTNYPYAGIPQPQFVVLRTSISAPSHDSYQGGEVNLQASVSDDGPIGAGGISLHLELSPGLRLVGGPKRRSAGTAPAAPPSTASSPTSSPRAGRR